MRRKREIVFEKLNLLYAIVCTLGGLKLSQDIGDLYAIGLMIIIYLLGVLVFEAGYDLWVNDNDLEEEDE